MTRMSAIIDPCEFCGAEAAMSLGWCTLVPTAPRPPFADIVSGKCEMPPWRKVRTCRKEACRAQAAELRRSGEARP
jgi:hypothetical protein